MTFTARVFLVVLSLAAPLRIAAQTLVPPADDAIQFLIPVSSTAGAFDTNWRADVTATNENAVPVTIAGTTVAPLTTATLALPQFTGFVSIPRTLAQRVTLAVRVHDAARNASSWGTDVPAVPLTQFRRSTTLPGVPGDSRFRSLLRIYGSGTGAVAIVRSRDAQTGRLLEQTAVSLAGDSPSYAQIPLATSAAATRVLEITTAGVNDAPLWAFVSVTNNTTQEVTLVLPAIAASPEVVGGSGLLTAGHWGGALCMEVLPSVVNVSGSCAFGTFARPAVDDGGHFEAEGSWASGVGPVTLPGGQPAHFSGLMQGTKLTVIVQTASTTIGPFVLDYGATTPCPTPCP